MYLLAPRPIHRKAIARKMNQLTYSRGRYPYHDPNILVLYKGLNMGITGKLGTVTIWQGTCRTDVATNYFQNPSHDIGNGILRKGHSEEADGFG